MSLVRRLCSVDGMNPALVFCSCTRTPTFLCYECQRSHTNANPGRVHIIFQTNAFESQTEDYLKRLQVRALAIAQGRQEVYQSSQAVDDCIAELRRRIQDLTDYAQRTISTLEEIKTTLERDGNAALEEVERTLYSDNPVLAQPLSSYIRNFGPTSPRLFEYRIDSSQASLRHILRFKRYPYPENELSGEVGILPGICENSLRIYDPNNTQVVSVIIKAKFHIHTVYCQIDAQTVLCIGSYPVTVDVFALRLTDDYQTSSLESMSVPRCLSGVIKVVDFVYVFGGYNGAHMISCEKYSLVSKKWSPLSNMQNPRHAFTPNLFGGEIYLADTSVNHNVVETFNIVTEQFKALPVLLSGLNNYCVSFIEDGELIIITEGKRIGKWRINSGETSFKITTVEFSGNAYSNCPPIKFGREMRWVAHHTGNLMKFNLDTNLIT